MTLPIETRPLQMLLTAPGAPALRPVLGAFDRRLSLKQLDDGAYLIGGGWPARVTDHAGNRYEMLDESVTASLETARAVFPPVGECAVARAGQDSRPSRRTTCRSWVRSPASAECWSPPASRATASH